MKQALINLLKQSGKLTTVSYEGKERRIKFDENFGKEKLDLIDIALGEEENKQKILKKIK